MLGQLRPNLSVNKTQRHGIGWNPGWWYKQVGHSSRGGDLWRDHQNLLLLGRIKQVVFKQSPSALGGQHDQRGLQIHFFLDNYCSAHQMFGQSLQDWMRFDRQQLTRHG